MKKYIRMMSLFIAALLILGAQPQAGKYTKLNFQNVERQYILYVPQVKKEKYPLVIVLHGAAGSGQKMERSLGFDKYAEKEGFVVVYPDAAAPLTGRRKSGQWNDGLGIFESSQRGIDDVGFILAMIEDISRKVTLDRSRIYVTGLSNGGAMTYRLGCQASEVFAAIAPVIATMPEFIYNNYKPQGPISFLSINGRDDPFIRLRGGYVKDPDSGEKVVTCSLKKSVSVFVTVNGCGDAYSSQTLPVIFPDGTSVEKFTYNNCQSDTEVISYIVDGMGHAWPAGPDSASGSRKSSTKNLDATKEIVEFFLRHHK